jgi:hypothetical protein
LEARDANYGNDIVDGTNPQQDLLRLHGPGRSYGCLNIADNDIWQGRTVLPVVLGSILRPPDNRANDMVSLINGTETSSTRVYSKATRFGVNLGNWGITEPQKKYGTLTVIEMPYVLRE